WKPIAKWNKLKKPYRLQVGQTLLLRGAKRAPKRKGDKRILAYWRKKLATKELELTGESTPEAATAAKPAKKKKVEPVPALAPPAPKLVVRQEEPEPTETSAPETAPA